MLLAGIGATQIDTDNRVIVVKGPCSQANIAKSFGMKEITLAVILVGDFESAASASSAIPAIGRLFVNCLISKSN
jgi:hypothetical protein